jgi:MerR family transcriptional regulator/heat shock protein HspR
VLDHVDKIAQTKVRRYITRIDDPTTRPRVAMSMQARQQVRTRQRQTKSEDDARCRERAALGAALSDDRAPRYTVGQVASLLGVQPWFLRRLDIMGVVTPTRSGGDQRRYSRADLERLIDARSLMREGVSVAGVRQVLDLRDRVAALEVELAEMRERRDGTAGARRSWSERAAGRAAGDHERSEDEGGRS